MQFYDQQGKDAWVTSFSAQREYDGKIRKSLIFTFTHMVWADDLQSALDVAADIFFQSHPLGAILLPSVGYGACLISRFHDQRHTVFFHHNPSDDPHEAKADTGLCQVHVYRLSAMSGDSRTDIVPVPPQTAVQMPSTLYYDEESE